MPKQDETTGFCAAGGQSRSWANAEKCGPASSAIPAPRPAKKARSAMPSTEDIENGSSERPRKEAGEERAALVLQVWSEQYEEGATRQVAVTQATAENKPIHQFIQNRVAVYMAANHHVPILETDPVWQSFSPRDIALLAAFAHQPTAWDAEPFLADGTILVLQGTDLEALEESFADAMEEYSLAEPARTFVQHVRAHHSTQSLSGTRCGKKLPYTGITQKVACHECAENDLKNGAAVMIVNFLSTNEDMEVETFHIPGLDTPTSDKYDIRTNPLPSQKEHIVRALLAASAMNSAKGGVLPIFLPTPAESAVRDNTLPSEDLDPLPLGEDCDPELENIIHKTLEDELHIFRTLGSQISPVAIKAVFSKLSHVVRRKLDRVVEMDVMQDIPREAFLGKVGGYWDSITGCGPQEERHLCRLSSSSIPAVGDIEIDILVKFIGPFVDFWRLDLFHSRYYWLHTLFMSRLLDRIHPLLVITHSSPVAAIFRLYDLATCWRHLSPETASAVWDGHTPSNVLQQLPQDTIPRQYCGPQFNKAVGTLQIIQLSSDRSKLALSFVHADMGQLKYDPTLARLQWAVSYHCLTKSDTVVQIVAAKLKTGGTIDWSDVESIRRWLREVQAAAEARLEAAGVTRVLDSAKSALRRREVVVNFLRSLVRAPPASYKYTVQKERLTTAPAGPQWEAQLERILERANKLAVLGLPPDPDCIAPLHAPILSSFFPPWFRSLKDDIDVVASANAHGRMEKGVENAKRTQAAISQWNKDNVDLGAIANRAFREAVSDTGSLGQRPFTISELQFSWRMIVCLECGCSTIRQHNVCYHRCVDATDDTADKTLTETNFPTIERILYAHDLFHVPSLVDELGSPVDAMMDMALVAIPAREILARPHSRPALATILRRRDLSIYDKIIGDPAAVQGDVYLPVDRVDDLDFALTHAVDIILRDHSQCPQHLHPTTSAHRRAWKIKESNMLEDWINGEAKTTIYSKQRDKPGYEQREEYKAVKSGGGFTCGPESKVTDVCDVRMPSLQEVDPALHIVTCTGDPKQLADGAEVSYFVTNKVEKKMSGELRVDCTCPMCSNSKACKYRQFYTIPTIFHLPPHYTRRLWFGPRFETERPPKRLTKTKKAERAAAAPTKAVKGPKSAKASMKQGAMEDYFTSK
ncbi:hypothetical protein B0H13DRAFT_1866871 [Mycena leptocephala]|nr:hypothetical protein B0H13DRAFT_1866871 [Mycena leptocephala]